MKKLVALNEHGRRIGQEHPRAKLGDDEVGLMLDLREEGYSYQWLADKFGVSKSCARWICTGRNRNQTAAAHHLVSTVPAVAPVAAPVTRLEALTAQCSAPNHRGVKRVFLKTEMTPLARGWCCAGCTARAQKPTSDKRAQRMPDALVDFLVRRG